MPRDHLSTYMYNVLHVCMFPYHTISKAVFQPVCEPDNGGRLTAHREEVGQVVRPQHRRHLRGKLEEILNREGVFPDWEYRATVSYTVGPLLDMQ